MYSRSEVCDRRRELPVSVCRNSGRCIDVLSNGYSATGSGVGRMLNVARSWTTADAEGRSKDAVGIGGGCQSEEEYGSGEGLREHLDNE